MNGMCKCIHSLRKSARPVARVIVAASLVLLPTAGCEKEGVGTPPPQATKAAPEAKPAPTTTPPDPQPQQAAATTSHVADKTVLPSPQQIFERHIEATGGREAYGKIHNALMRGTITVTGADQELGLTEYRASPNKYLHILESGDSGVLREGCDGETVWQMPEGKDPRIFEGAPKAALLREGVFNSLLHTADLYEIVETIGVEEIDATQCYHVLMTPPQGLSESNFYSIESGLLVMRRILVRGPFGDVPRATAFGDYEETAGIRSPRKSIKRQMGRAFVATIDSIEYNVELPGDLFDLPDEVRAALEQANTATNEDPPSPDAAEQP